MSKKKGVVADSVVFLNPTTCGVWKNGGTRYKVDHSTGRRTADVDNELGEYVDRFLEGNDPPGTVRVPVADVFSRRVLVPRYYDERWLGDFQELIAKHRLHAVSLGDLFDAGMIEVFGGHGSPSNDMRAGDIPYVKVSDVRNLRVNVNPTNLVSRAVAERFWGGPSSGLQGWDLITPNRASSNIGEFAVLLPGEEERVLTKEVFVIRVKADNTSGWDWAYLLWSLCLTAVRKQWQRVALMQTNREDVGGRYREILLPAPRSSQWATQVSAPFRDYFTTIAESRQVFAKGIESSPFQYIASVQSIATGADATGAEPPTSGVDGEETGAQVNLSGP